MPHSPDQWQREKGAHKKADEVTRHDQTHGLITEGFFAAPHCQQGVEQAAAEKQQAYSSQQ